MTPCLLENRDCCNWVSDKCFLILCLIRVTSPPSSTEWATLVTGSVYVRRWRPCSMFLASNTWPLVAVRSAQLQLVLLTAVQSSESLDIFRRRLKTELFARSYNWHRVWQMTHCCVSQQLFAVAATLKSIDYNVAITFILNNNNNNLSRIVHRFWHCNDKFRNRCFSHQSRLRPSVEVTFWNVVSANYIR